MNAEAATQVGITLGELLGVAVIIIGALWAIGKIGMGQYMKRMDEKFLASDERMEAKFKASDLRIDDRFHTIDSKLRTFDPLHGELARVDRDLMQVRLEVAERLEKYIRSDALQRLDDKITRLFGEVFNKLDSKADKTECLRHHDGRGQ